MNWKDSLGRHKFNSILFAATIEMTIGILMSLIDTGVSGHILGVRGLSAMNLIGPVTGFTIFTEGLFSVGTSMVYASYKGEYQVEKAEAAFGTGIVASIVLGLLTSLVLLCVVPPYLAYLGVSTEITKLVMDFLFFLYPQLAMAPVYQLLSQMVITDGGEVLGTAANIAETVLNLVLSIILGMKMGILGIGLGTLLSTLAGLGIVSLHFLSKRNGLRARLAFDPEDLKRMFYFGANDSSMFFLMPILSFVTIKFVMLRFGEFYLPILTIIYSIFEITVIFEATGEAMRPIMPIYYGDQNYTGIMWILNYSTIMNLRRAVGFSVLLLVAAPYIPIAFDIHDPVLLEECTAALRIYALAGPGLAVVANFNSFYLNTRKPMLAVLESVLNNLVCILVSAIPLGMLFGIKGMMLGFAAAPYLTAAILLGYVYLHYGKDLFPSLVPRLDDAVFWRSILLTEESIMALVYDVHDFLEENHIDHASRGIIEVTLEELLFLIRDENQKANNGEKSPKIYAECFVHPNEQGVDVSIWDSGEIFDITDVDSDMINFRSYVVERILSQQDVKKHMVATSFNKNFFRFPSREPKPGTGRISADQQTSI
jgi:Na+-driven multidrug efflux pump